MKKTSTMTLLLLILLVLGSETTALGADTEETTKVGKDIYFTLGYKSWYNTWQTPLNTWPDTDGANIISTTSDAVAASIYSASLKLSDFLIAGSYMTTPEYTFPDYIDVSNLTGNPTPTAVTGPFYYYKTTAKRKEHDINLGYYVAPGLALTIGYKEVKQTYTTTWYNPGVWSETFPPSTTKYSGPIIGITGGGALGAGFAFYGNLSYGFLKGAFEGDPNKFDATYSSTELGIAYRPVSFLSFLVGYKYQTIDTKFTDDPAFNNQVALDVTKGFILGANLTF